MMVTHNTEKGPREVPESPDGAAQQELVLAKSWTRTVERSDDEWAARWRDLQRVEAENDELKAKAQRIVTALRELRRFELVSGDSRLFEARHGKWTQWSDIEAILHAHQDGR